MSRYLDALPPLLQHTLNKMPAKEPERRYQQIGDMHIDLQELIGETTRSSTAQTEIVSFAARARKMHAPCSENGRIEP